MVEKSEKRKIDREVKVSEFKPGLACIGSLCFTEDGGITVKVARGASPICARRTADAILGGRPVKFEIEAEEKEEDPKIVKLREELRAKIARIEEEFQAKIQAELGESNVPKRG